MPDTIFALSSGRPPAAVAIIRLSGPTAHDAGRRLAGGLPPAREAAVRRLRDPASGEPLDQALVLRFDQPASATGEDLVELHCHGGRAVIDAVIAALGNIDGLRPALPGEYTRRAFENGRIDLTEAEGLADLLAAETESQRRAALLLAEGGLRRVVDDWQARLLELSAAAERAIDYAEEDEHGADPAISAGAKSLADDLATWLDRPRAEPLHDGIRIVVAGPPNAGKSSLINVIAGVDRIIVSDVAGTTRDAIEVPLAIAGLPLVLVDTAGLRGTDDAIEAQGVRLARRELATADVLLWLGPSGECPDHPHALPIHAKSDVAGAAPKGSLAVSAVTGQGLPELVDAVVSEARSLLPSEGAIAFNRRQAEEVEQCRDALEEAAGCADPAIQAECLRSARAAFDRLTGKAGVESLLDTLFARFCLGK